MLDANTQHESIAFDLMREKKNATIQQLIEIYSAFLLALNDINIYIYYFHNFSSCERSMCIVL